MKDEYKTRKYLTKKLIESREKGAQLEGGGPKRKHKEEKLRHDLTKRVKELDCLYGVSHLVGKEDTPLEDILEGIVNLIPPAWQYPDITCARVLIEGQEVKTNNFQKTPWKLESDISEAQPPSVTFVSCWPESNLRRNRFLVSLILTVPLLS